MIPLLCAATASDVDSTSVSMMFMFTNLTTGAMYTPTAFAKQLRGTQHDQHWGESL